MFLTTLFINIRTLNSKTAHKHVPFSHTCPFWRFFCRDFFFFVATPHTPHIIHIPLHPFNQIKQVKTVRNCVVCVRRSKLAKGIGFPMNRKIHFSVEFSSFFYHTGLTQRARTVSLRQNVFNFGAKLFASSTA